VKVTIRISKKTHIPTNTIAKLTSLDLLGTKGITLEMGSSPVMAANEQVLQGAIEGGIIDKVSSEITPLMQDVRNVVLVVDSVLSSVNGILNEQTRADLQNSIAALHTSMDNFSSLSGTLNKESAQLAGVIRNANSITTNIANNNADIQRIISNARLTTDQLAAAPIQQTFAELNTASLQIKELMARINSGDGSLGQLVNDKALYNNLNSTLNNLSELAGDLKAHPSRYINVTIFGRKRQVGQ
jgi:phospholipid/cholesterol/gamma-HCH transport system substrate-binding protein